MTVYVCFDKDIECGNRPENWCAGCPKHALRGPSHSMDPARERELQRGPSDSSVQVEAEAKLGEIIEVVCMAMPDGTTFWMERGDDYPERAQRVIDAWKANIPADRRPLYERCLGGFVVLRMPQEDYLHNIKATNQGAAIFAAAGMSQ